METRDNGTFNYLRKPPWENIENKIKMMLFWLKGYKSFFEEGSKLRTTLTGNVTKKQ